MYFDIKIYSKNKNSLNKFLFFISNINIPLKTVFNVPNEKKKTFLTVLKSPHVNKDAQDQFEFKMFSKSLIVYSNQPKLFILVLKKIINESFSDIKIKIYCYVTLKKKLLINIFNPLSVSISFVFFKKHNNFFFRQQLTRYLKLFDCCGEIVLKTL